METMATQHPRNPVYFEGAIFGEALRTYFCAADIFMLTGDGGLAVNEAMAYGMPIISPIADGTIPDLVLDGINGFLLVREDQDEINTTLKTMIELDAKRLEAMGNASKAIIAEKASLSNMVDQFMRCFSILVADGRGSN